MEKQIKPIVGVLDFGKGALYTCKFLATPELSEQQQERILQFFEREEYFGSVSSEQSELLRLNLGQKGSFWERNSGLCHYEWDAETLAESSIDKFINHYLYPFLERLQVPLVVGKDEGQPAQQFGVPDATPNDWVYSAEINNVIWWITMDFWKISSDDWQAAIERYVQIINAISSISGSKYSLYYEDQGDEVVFIVLSEDMCNLLVEMKLISVMQ